MVSSSESGGAAAVRPSPWRRTWLLACAVAGLGFFVSVIAEIPWRSALRGYDNTLNYLWLRSALVDHDWDFANDVAAAPTLVSTYRDSLLALPRTATGRVPDKYGVGWALLSLPFYLGADAIVALGRALGLWSLASDGFNPVYQICVLTGHLLLAFASLRLAVRVVRAWTGDADAALAGVTLVWATSPLLYYQTANLSMSHAATFFAVTLMAFGLTRARETPARAGPWLLAGAGLGLAAITRYQAAVFGLVPLVTLVLVARRDGRAAGRALGWFALAAAPFLALQLVAWHAVYGRWLVFSYGAEGEGFHWLRPHLAASLFSSWHGLFYWHPFLLVAGAGLVGWAWRHRDPGLAWLATWLVVAYVNAAWWCWWLASSFGNRAYDAALLPLMAGLAWLLQRSGPRLRAAIWTLGVAAATWNVYVLLLYRTAAISRNGPVTWEQMVAAAARLPQALGLH